MVSFQSVNDQANQLANHLKQLGVGPETRVGIFVERSPTMAMATLGVLKTGGTYIPLDTHWPLARLTRILSSQTVGHLITHHQWLRRVEDLQWQCPSLTHVICVDVEAAELLPEPFDQTTTQSLWDWIAQNWELQDKPEHLKTIRDRILKNEQYTTQLLAKNTGIPSPFF